MGVVDAEAALLDLGGLEEEGLRLRVPPERLVERRHIVHRRRVLVVVVAEALAEETHLLLRDVECVVVLACARRTERARLSERRGNSSWTGR